MGTNTLGNRRVNKLSTEEVDKLFSNYETKHSGQMVKSLGKLIIRTYLKGACATLGITNEDALSKELESDLLINSTLQRFTCKLYYRLSLFLAPLIVGLITSRHYLLEWNVADTKKGRTNRDDRPDKRLVSNSK